MLLINGFAFHKFHIPVSRYVLGIDVHFSKSLVLWSLCLNPVCSPVSVEAPLPVSFMSSV